MSVDTLSTFFAVGAVAIMAIIALMLLLRIAALASPGAREWWDAVADSLAPSALWLAFFAAAIATAGSLYYSLGAGLTPCELCWYQRIAMYPLTVVLGVAALAGDHKVWRTALPLSIVGTGLAGYHYLIQRFPDLASGACSADVPCTAAYVWKFDFVSIPFMALSLFLAITGLVLVDRARAR